MDEQEKKIDQKPGSGTPEAQTGDELDAASRSLSEALRVSFIVLKVIMIVLVVLFLASGLKTVGPDEKALVLQFGRIRPVGDEGLLGPGLRWVLPYPIEEIVRIPVEKRVNLAVDSFWYYQPPEELIPESPKQRARIGPTLEPLRDGYCLTRSGQRDRPPAGSTESDYSIVHCKWQITYQIDRPMQFFKNVYVEQVKPGQLYFDVIRQGVTPLVESLVEDAVVTTMVNYTIDEAISSDVAIGEEVGRRLQGKLDEIGSGIKVVFVQLAPCTWPRQVNEAFERFISASQERQSTIAQARTTAETTLIEAESQAVEIVADANAYRTEVVATAEATAKYLTAILPEYRKWPELVKQRIYLDAMEEVLQNADEIFVIQPGDGVRHRETRILINRDPKLKPKSASE